MSGGILEGPNSIFPTTIMFSFYILQMEDSNLVTLELLKPLIFKAGFQGLSAFFPK